jgi:hypothetical protein
MNGKVLHRHGYKTSFVISGFCRDVNENCAFLGYYAARRGNSLPKFWDNLSVPSSMEGFLTVVDGTDKSVVNISKELLLHAA